ncbi:TRAP-type C4-dicarboxylate transport system substrate-binding protein [Breoghania corrubedonensis]|uniref:TRAP-type C4-dicarboxylate transport system substrate-binding protein n=2 Tax=Breoghania corrubedonensis TaxID=665038 RepID=A0A2T5VF71_9HYPH|nr:TRAP-type C4-dicarboxylate transport system substrate-binding protein [Breoghania corrubedonensis]
MINARKLAIAATTGALAFGFAAEAFAAEVTWNVSLWGNRRAFTENVEYLAERVAKESNGRFEIKLHYGASLSKARENLDGISIGAFEMAQICASYHADKNPTLTVLELPFLGVSDLKTEARVSMKLYEQDVVKKDLARWNAIAFMPTPMPQYNFLGKGEAPTSIKDFDGMRVRALGGIGELMRAVGAVPTTVTAAETYQAMESGTVQAASFAPHAHLAFKTVEVGNWWTANMNPGTVQCPVVMNSDAYAALPDDLKKILDESVQPAVDHYIANYETVYDRWWPTLKKQEITQVTFSDAELAALKEKAAPIWKAWVDKMEAQGIPGQELLDKMQAEIKG